MTIVFRAWPYVKFIETEQILKKENSQNESARPYVKFIETQSNLWRKKIHRTNQGSNFLGGNFSNRDNVRVPIQFRGESQPQHLKR